MESKLDRFVNAQSRDYLDALTEIKNGRKQGHWMWYIFPQIAGLGFSETSKYYAVNDIEEAQKYLNYPVLGNHLIEISTERLKLDIDKPVEIFGHTDALKLRSSMTLFANCTTTNEVFQLVLNKFFGNIPDNRTIEILGK
jgi:uncharacterized protein (DUF1810 family)